MGYLLTGWDQKQLRPIKRKKSARIVIISIYFLLFQEVQVIKYLREEEIYSTRSFSQESLRRGQAFIITLKLSLPQIYKSRDIISNGASINKCIQLVHSQIKNILINAHYHIR